MRRPKFPQRVPRSPPSAPGARQKRPKTGPGARRGQPVDRPSACHAPSAGERAFESLFRRSRVAARKLRCAFRISFNGVLLTSDEVSQHTRAQRQRVKIEAFRPAKSSPGVSGPPKTEPDRHSTSEEVRSKCPRGFRKFFSQRKRSNFERKSAPRAGTERADLRVIEIRIMCRCKV